MRRIFRSTILRLRALFRQTATDRDLDEEIRLHLELETEKNITAGMTPAAARRKAVLDFGGVERTKEAHRDGWGVRWLQELAADIRYAFRHLRHSPGFAAAAILTLAFGIGANTAMFSVLNALVLRQLPIEDPEGLISITALDQRGRRAPTPLPVVGELAGHGPLVDVCGYNGGGRQAVEVNGITTSAVNAFVTGACFKTFGVAPILGRTITGEDAPLFSRGNRVAVISHRFWMRMFGGDPGALGRTIQINGVSLTIIGILPPAFGGLQADAGDEIFAPFDTVYPSPADRRPFAMEILGRLRPGVSLDEATAELTARWHALIEPTVSPRLLPSLRADLLSTRPRVGRVATGLSQYRQQYAHPVSLILGLTGVLLLLACVNLGALLLARLGARRTELAIRLALGGSRRRVAQQMLMESLLLSLSGAAIAVPLAFAAVKLLVSFIPGGFVGRTMTFTPDAPALLLTALVAVGAAILMSVLPIWTALRHPASVRVASGRTTTGGASRWGRALLVVQVALSIVLLIGAGLLARSLYLLRQLDPGVRTAGVLTVSASPIPHAPAGLSNRAYYSTLFEKLSGVPGVRSVGFAHSFPTGGFRPAAGRQLAFTGEPFGHVTAVRDDVSPGFFETVGIPLLAGRFPEWSDDETSRRVIVISESLARELQPEGSLSALLDRHVRFDGLTPSLNDLTIVGVVGNATQGNPRDVDPPVMYVPALQEGDGPAYPTFVIATAGDPLRVAPSVRQVLDSGGREYVREMAPLADVLTRAPSTLRMSATLAGAIGGLALLLALIGIYGALAYAVSRRTREIGVRVALGAAPASVARMVLREGLILTLAGIVVGLPLAFAAGRALRSLMFGITAADTLTFAAVSAFFILLALAAGFFPARHATKVDPRIALRAE